MVRPFRPAILLLVLSAILFRGLIPAGFMPATAQAARHGALLMVCSHGEMKAATATDRDGKRTAHAGVEQCPFGAAVGPALPVALPSLAIPMALGRLPEAWAVLTRSGPSLHLQPPARGPPDMS